MTWTNKDFAEAQKRFRQRKKNDVEWQKKRKIQSKEGCNKFRKEHPDRWREICRESQIRYRENHPLRYVIHRQNSRAKIDYGLTSKVTEEQWSKIKYKSPFCPICKKKIGCENLEMDHIIPMKDGGDHTPDNIQAMCRSCNARKNPQHRIKIK